MQKTAALFESCATIGALSAGASSVQVEAAKVFGRNIGIIFQIRDDIFDYFDSKDIGKPTGNDMMEGKLTLPIIYALNHQPNPQMDLLAQKVKNGTVKTDEIAKLVDFAKQNGGIEYAEKRMKDYHQSAKEFINRWVIKDDLKTSLSAYLDFVIERQI